MGLIANLIAKTMAYRTWHAIASRMPYDFAAQVVMQLVPYDGDVVERATCRILLDTEGTSTFNPLHRAMALIRYGQGFN